MPDIFLSTGRSFPGGVSTVSILDAARLAGVTLEYSCRTGRCGVCKAPVLAGQTTVLRHEESLTADEAAAGLILTCCRAAVGDLSLDIEPFDRLADIEIKTLPCRIVALDPLAPDVVRATLKTPPAAPLRFLPGQYIDVIAADGRRSYSLANAPRADGLLELVIKRYAGGVLSGYWFDRARLNDLLRLEGPFGTFFRRDQGAAEIVFLATGTGIAPVKALLEELAGGDTCAPQISVFWGNRDPAEFWWDPRALGLDLDFNRLLSGSDSSWREGRGYVQDAAIRRGIDPATTVVYGCGSSAMIASAREALLGLGLPSRRFLSDAFVSSN